MRDADIELLLDRIDYGFGSIVVVDQDNYRITEMFALKIFQILFVSLDKLVQISFAPLRSSTFLVVLEYFQKLTLLENFPSSNAPSCGY